MTIRDNDNPEKLVRLAVELDEQFASEQLNSAGSHISSLLQPNPGELTDEEVKKLNQAKDVLAFLKQVRTDLNQLGSNPAGANPSNHEPTLPLASRTRIANAPPTSVPHLNMSGDSQNSIGQSFGRFRIDATIGQGGFARVFRAWDPLLEREVALKIPRPNILDSDESKARFVREGKAVALLSHPSIVTVFEAGSMGPINYIASEFCPGQTLACWLSKEDQVDIRVAASVVATLAEAVHHAHQRGIIHRDLKPANILVENGDSELTSRLRITDFGLAKHLASDDVDTLTMDGAVVGTPSYMSPEQVRCDPEIGIATDIYSLGVILYELLTGSPPHKKGSISATIRAVEMEAATPTRKIRAAIPVELDAICQKCLEKEPHCRYRNAFELSADLSRFLNGETVVARRPSVFDRLNKWARRNKMIAASLALTFLTLVAGIGTSWSMYQKSERDRTAAVRAKDEAIELRQAEADALELAESRMAEMREQMEMLTNIFDELKGTEQGEFDSKTLGESLRENLVQASESIFDSDADPSLRTKMAARLGHCLGNLGYGEESLEVTTEALELARKSKLPESVLLELQLYSAFGRSYSADYQAAVEELNTIIEPVIDNDQISDKNKITALSTLAHGYHNTNRPKEASRVYRQIIDFFDRRNVAGKGSQENANQFSNTGRDYLASRRALRIYVTAGYQLAMNEYQMQPSELNLNNLLHCRDSVESQLGADDWGTIGASYSVAMILGQRDRVDEAISMAETAFQDSLTTFGQTNYQTITAINSLVVICGTHLEHSFCEVRLPEILDIGRAACQTRLEEYGDSDLQTIKIYQNIAKGYELAGDPESCVQIRRELLLIAERTQGCAHEDTQKRVLELATALHKAGKNTVSRQLLEEFILFAEKRNPEDVQGIAEAKQLLKLETGAQPSRQEPQ